MNGYQTSERISLITRSNVVHFEFQKMGSRKFENNFCWKIKNGPSKQGASKAHISSDFQVLGCGKFFYQYGAGHFTLTVYPAMSHDFALCIPELQDSVDSFAEIRDFVNANMK